MVFKKKETPKDREKDMKVSKMPKATKKEAPKKKKK